MSKFRFFQKDLNTNIGELALEIVREFYVASKKVAVYSLSHPLSGKAIGRLFLQMGKAYRFKKYVNFHIEGGRLFVLNIELRSSVFSDQIIEYMQLLDIKNILFDSNISMKQLSSFLDRVVNSGPAGIYQNMMQEFLDKNNIDSIKINSERGILLFEKGVIYRAEIDGDFSIRNLLGQSLGQGLDKLAKMLSFSENEIDLFIEKFNIDYYPQLVAYLIPEKISLIDSDKLLKLVNDRIDSIVDNNQNESTKQSLNELKVLLDALNLHPARDNIFNQIESTIAYNKISKDIYSEVVPQTSVIRVESTEKVNQFLYTVFNPELPGYKLDDFEDLFGRIIRTGQKNRARSVINILISHLAGPHFELRERALILLRFVLGAYQQLNADFLLDHTIEKIDNYLTDELETFEFSDLIWAVAKICLSTKDYKRLSSLCDVLSGRSHKSDGIRCYETVAVRKSIEELNRVEVINQLVNELVKEDSRKTGYLKNILVTIASEKAAYSLASIISHDSRQVRMNVLKILSEMGKPALKVCSEILKDESNFIRDSGKRELPDDKWFIVRNAVFVLGSLGDPEGCHALRYRIAEDDTRIRLAIISALEKIGDEAAADLLLVMSDDNDREIREAAIIALGLTGQTDIAPELISLAEKRNTEILTIIAALGSLGGTEAGKFLSNLLDDNNMLSKYTSNRASRDDIRIAVVKTLGRIGDSESIKTVKNYQDSLSSTQKIFFGGLRINRAIEDILKNKN
ncbi:MAG TPA: HEAT repeat domain-containing protein [candidate division Zixibacteria bacterium]|nr:HEAT repeat domain-containing protein [candidate division Zixibacteria bacterium]